MPGPIHPAVYRGDCWLQPRALGIKHPSILSPAPPGVTAIAGEFKLLCSREMPGLTFLPSGSSVRIPIGTPQ